MIARLDARNLRLRFLAGATFCVFFTANSFAADSCASRYRRFMQAMGNSPKAELVGVPIPGTEMTLIPMNSAGLAGHLSDFARENSFFSLFEHQGRFLGIDPKANFPKGGSPQFFAELPETVEGRGRIPKAAFNHSVDFDTATDEGSEKSGEFYRMALKDLERQRSKDSRWSRIGDRRKFPIFSRTADSPVMQTFLRSLLGKHIAGLNVMTNEIQGEKFTVFSGQVRRIFSMKCPEGYCYGELIYAEIRSLDGKISTVLLNPNVAMSHPELYVYDYRYPPLVESYRKRMQSFRKTHAQALQDEFRNAPVMSGDQEVGSGRPLPADPEVLQKLIDQGAGAIERLGAKKAMAFGGSRIGSVYVNFFLPRKSDYSALRKGEILVNLANRSYYIVGVDRIPPDLLHNYRTNVRSPRLVLLGGARPALPGGGSAPALDGPKQ